MASVFDIELKLHYYLVNGAITRNYWSMTAPAIVSETLKCSCSHSEAERENLVFLEKIFGVKGLFLFQIFILTSPCVFSSDQRDFLERHKPFFWLTSPKSVCLRKGCLCNLSF